MEVPAKKMSDIGEAADDAVGAVMKSKIQWVKPASKDASSCAEEPERGILPWVESRLMSICDADLRFRKCVLVPFSSNAKASEDETMMDLKVFLSTLLTRDDRQYVQFTRV